jgi:hypothetical protein
LPTHYVRAASSYILRQPQWARPNTFGSARFCLWLNYDQISPEPNHSHRAEMLILCGCGGAALRIHRALCLDRFHFAIRSLAIIRNCRSLTIQSITRPFFGECPIGPQIQLPNRAGFRFLIKALGILHGRLCKSNTSRLSPCRNGSATFARIGRFLRVSVGVSPPGVADVFS